MSNEPKHTATPIGYILLRRIVVNEQIQNEDGSYEWKPMKSDFQKDYKTKRLYVSEKSALFAADQMLKIYPADEFKAIPVYKDLIDTESLRAENAELIEALRSIIAQWDTPNWKLTESTGTIINQARQTLAKYEKP